MACIEDIECRVEVDKLLRRELSERGNLFDKTPIEELGSPYIYDKSPTLVLIEDILNRAYKKKRKALVARGNNNELYRFRTQKSYWVNIENIIERYKEKENFIIVYKPCGSKCKHALKVLMVEGDTILAQDLCTGQDKIDIRRHRVVDLTREGQDVVMIMDSDELTEEELSAIVLDQNTYSRPEVEKVVDLNYASSGDIYFRVKSEKLKSGPRPFLSEKYSRAYILADFRNGAYHGIMLVDRFINNYTHQETGHDPAFYESSELIIQASKEFKEKYFKQELELTAEERKTIKTVIYESAK